MRNRDQRIDAYIKDAAPFARPILRHLRAVVHEGCPQVTETIKWGMPHFDYKGLFCGMAAFKAHATFGFWRARAVTSRLPKVKQKAMGQFGRLTSIDDLPSRAALVRMVKAARKLKDEGVA